MTECGRESGAFALRSDEQVYYGLCTAVTLKQKDSHQAAFLRMQCTSLAST